MHKTLNTQSSESSKTISISSYIFKKKSKLYQKKKTKSKKIILTIFEEENFLHLMFLQFHQLMNPYICSIFR